MPRIFLVASSVLFPWNILLGFGMVFALGMGGGMDTLSDKLKLASMIASFVIGSICLFKGWKNVSTNTNITLPLVTFLLQAFPTLLLVFLAYM